MEAVLHQAGSVPAAVCSDYWFYINDNYHNYDNYNYDDY